MMNLLRLEQDLRTTSSLLYICPLRLIYYRCLVYRCSFLVRRLQKEEPLKVRVTKASEVCEKIKGNAHPQALSFQVPVVTSE